MAVRRFLISFLTDESAPGSPSSLHVWKSKTGKVDVDVTSQQSVGVKAMPKSLEIAVASTKSHGQTHGTAEDAHRWSFIASRTPSHHHSLQHPCLHPSIADALRHFHLEGLLRGPARRNLPADEKPEEAKSNDADNAEHHHNTGLAGGEVVASDESVADGRHFEVGYYISGMSSGVKR
jgi:hypothetical protein